MKIMNTLAAKTFAIFILSIAAISAQGALVDLAEYQDWENLAASISSENVNAEQADGMTALLWASYYDQTDVIRMLLDAGADPNIPNRYAMTALIQSAMNGNNEAIILLLNAGADPSARTLEGDSAILNAAKTGANEGLQALLEAGADVDSRDGYLFQTPLMWAAAANQAESVRILIANGADLDARSAELDLRGVLVDSGHGDLPDGGLTALHHAARENSIESAQVLMDMGANPNITDPQEITPLRVAFINANLDLAKILIAGGANVNDGSFVELLDVELSQPMILRSETNHENQSTIEEIMDFMLAHGLDIDSTPATPFPYPGTRRIGGRGTSGQTALYNAAIGPHLNYMGMLLERGANPNSLNNENQYLPLSAALDVIPLRDVLDNVKAMEELTPAAELLFEHGADVNAVTADGTTVLHHAAARGRDEVVEFLLANGADLNVRDLSNRTALDIANGVPEVWDGEGRRPAEPAVFETTAEILTEAMHAQGITIEQYLAPATDNPSEA